MAAWPGGFSSFQRGRANFSVLLLKNIYEASSLLPALVPRIWQEGEQGRNGESPLVRAFAYAHKQKDSSWRGSNSLEGPTSSRLPMAVNQFVASHL